MKNHFWTITLAVLLALGLTVGSAWAVPCTVPSVAYPTIQSAEDDATCDTINVKKCGPPNATCGPNGVYHESVDIDKRLTLNCNGAVLDGAPEGGPQIADDGIDILPGADGTTVKGCTVQNFKENGIQALGVNGLTIENCTLKSNGSRGLVLNGDDFLIESNKAIENAGDGFKLLSADDGIIRNNLAGGNNSDGFDVLGDRLQILNNRALRNHDDGFEVDSNETTIMGNRAETNNDKGFDLNDFSETTISGNKSSENKNEGFEMGNLDENLIENNLANDNGEEGFSIYSDSDSNTFKSNRSIGNFGDGINISDCCSDSNTLINNTIRNNYGDGIDIDGNTTDTIIDGNRVMKNRGTGIENDGGSDTIIKNNTMKGNRTDLAGMGDECDDSPATDSATDGGGNSFDSGGFDVCTPGTGGG